MSPGCQAADLVIIGAGAAGLVAAIEAARAIPSGQPGRIVLLEKNDRPGRKLLATGNGRCNITNLNTQAATFHGQDPRFTRPALAAFPVAETLGFFLELGLPCREEAEGRVYPCCQQAAAVLDVLLKEIAHLPIEIICQVAASEIRPTTPLLLGSQPLDPANRWEVETAEGQVWQTPCVILATGGKAAPNLGSDGSGYALARPWGHQLVEPLPALVQVETSGRKTHPLAGVRVEAGLRLMHQHQVLAQEAGEVLLTDYGLSGIPILQLSRIISETLQRGTSPLQIELDLLPELTVDAIASLVSHRQQLNPELPLGDLLTGLVHQKIGRQLTREVTGLPAETPVAVLNPAQVRALAQAIKHDPFTIRQTRDFSQAQVTAGGLSTADFEPSTLESRLSPGLYAAGEILDIDGDCGGFNLQWAWSSGRLAGRTAMRAAMQLEAAP